MPPMAQVNYAPFRRTKKWPAIFREPNDDKQRLFKKNGKLFLDGALRWAYVGGRTGKNGVEVLQSMNSPNSNALTGRKDRVHCSGGEACNREEKTTRRRPQGSHFDCRKALPCLATGMSRESKTMTTRHERYSNAMQLRIRQHFSAFHILFWLLNKFETWHMFMTETLRTVVKQLFKTRRSRTLLW